MTPGYILYQDTRLRYLGVGFVLDMVFLFEYSLCRSPGSKFASFRPIGSLPLVMVGYLETLIGHYIRESLTQSLR